MQRLRTLKTENRCKRGWYAIVELQESAIASFNKGDLDTAGTTFNEVTKISNEIETYLTIKDRIANSTDQLTSLYRNTKAVIDEAQKTTYVSPYRGNFKGIVARLAESGEKIRQPDKWEQLRQIDAQMEGLAKEGKYLNATERAIEGYNVALQELQEALHRGSGGSGS